MLLQSLFADVEKLKHFGLADRNLVILLMFESSIHSCFFGLFLPPTVNQRLHIEPMLVVKNLQQIDACCVIRLFLIAFSLYSLESHHIWHYFELQALPVEQPSELLYPFLSLESASCLKYLYVEFRKDDLHIVFVFGRLVINPKYYVFLKSDRGWQLNQINLFVWVTRNDLLYQKGSERCEQNLLLMRIHRVSHNFLTVEGSDVKESAHLFLQLCFEQIFSFVGDCEVVKVKGLLLFEEVAEPEVFEAHVAFFVVVGQ